MVSFLVLYLVQVELQVQHALHAYIPMQANKNSKCNVKVSTPKEPIEKCGMSSLHPFRFSRPKIVKTKRMCCFSRYRFNIPKNTNVTPCMGNVSFQCPQVSSAFCAGIKIVGSTSTSVVIKKIIRRQAGRAPAPFTKKQIPAFRAYNHYHHHHQD